VTREDLNPAGARLVSGDAVEMDVRYARLGSRAVARMLDVLAQIVLGILVESLASASLSTVTSIDPALASAMTIVVVVVVLVAYPTVMETFAGGRTLGKLAMGLRVVRDDGGPIRFRAALTRALVGISAEFPGLLPPFTWFASLATMLANPAGKRLGDIAAGTVVIHDRTPETWGWVPAMPLSLDVWAMTLDLTGLSDQLALAVRNYLSRNRKIREPARTRLGTQLAAEVAARVTPPAPPSTPGWAYLAAVLAERHRRATARLVRGRQATASAWPELAELSAVTPLALPLVAAAPAMRPAIPSARNGD
jgi:uncharacterized RDD family membrane protein YckC